MAPIKFEGDRSVEGFIQFMKFHTKEDLVFVDPEEKHVKVEGADSADTEESSGSCSAAGPEAGTCGADARTEL